MHRPLDNFLPAQCRPKLRVQTHGIKGEERRGREACMPETDDMNSEDVDATTTLEFPDSPPRRAAAAVRKARRHASFIWENSAGNFFF